MKGLQSVVSRFKFLLIFCVLPYVSYSQENTFNNPALFFGSSFGNIFQAYYKQGDYNMLLHLTSKKSRLDFSDETLLQYYQTMQFAFHIKLKSIKKEGDEFTLNYIADIQATKHLIRMYVVVEDDTCRFVFDKEYFKQTFLLLKKK